MRQMRAAMAAVPLALVLLTGAAPAATRIVSVAQADLRAGSTSALSVAVVDNGRITYAQTFGSADPDTAFSIGSVSKMFTAVSVMQLVQRGLLSLDAPVTKYLPQYGALHAVTIRELLSHTGGLPNIMDDAVASGDVQRPTTPAQILTNALAAPLDFTPGTDWNYTNTGYVALGQIIERVSGLPLAEYERRNIFSPGGMKHSFIAPHLGNDVARPFQGAPGDWSWYYAAGDVFSSATDLARFDIALMHGRLVNYGMLAQMLKTVPFPTFSPAMRDGLGLFVTQAGNVQLIGHHGGEPGFRADNEMILSRGFAVIILGTGAYGTQPLLLAAIATYVPGARLTGSTNAYPTDPARAVTRRLTAFVQGLQQGNIDASQLEVLVRTAFPSGAAVQKQLAPYGALRNVEFQSKLYTSMGKLYVYRVIFAKGSMTMEFVIDSENKFAHFFMRPVTQPA